MHTPEPDEAPSEAVRRFLAQRDATLARLRRVNAALAQWDEFAAAACLPADLRPAVPPPTLSREALKGLQAMLGTALVELDEAWQVRN